MNKKLIALAVVGAIFAPAVMAQSANPVTLYGTMNVDFESVKADGATGAGANLSTRSRVSSNSSNFGVRGTEDVGGGLKAWFQIEVGVTMDVGTNTSATVTSNPFNGRNSAVGLQGGAGSILLGNWDTPYKSAQGAVDPFYATGIGYYANVLSGNSTPTDTASLDRNAFDRRSGNSFQYWTPVVNGLSGRFAYSANEAKTNSTAAIGASPSLTSFSGTYAKGPIFLSLAHERHEQFANSATENSKDKGLKFTAVLTLGTTNLGFMAEQLKFNGNLAATGLPKNFTAGTSNEARVNAYFFSIVHRMGPHALRGAYAADSGVKLNGGGSSTDTKARMLDLGYSYSFSKRTDFYAIYAKVTNQTNSRNNFSINGISSVNGADPVGVGVGLRHTF